MCELARSGRLLEDCLSQGGHLSGHVLAVADGPARRAAPSDDGQSDRLTVDDRMYCQLDGPVCRLDCPPL